MSIISQIKSASLTPQIKAVISHYSLEVGGNENGAVQYRCDFKLIDPKKGSTTGYIAK
jgi:hypothetical protein